MKTLATLERSSVRVDSASLLAGLKTHLQYLLVWAGFVLALRLALNMGLPIAVGFVAAFTLFLDGINGCHDMGPLVGPLIGSGAAKRGWALALCGTFNFAGAMIGGSKVALLIAAILPSDLRTMPVIACALTGALSVNLYTYLMRMPASSSHMIVGALSGVGVAAAGWHGLSTTQFKLAVIAVFASPILGYVLCFVLGKIVAWATARYGTNKKIETGSRWVQYVSAIVLSFEHGRSDAPKGAGIIIAALMAAFPEQFKGDMVPWEVFTLCALAIGIGSVIGTQRITDTVIKRYLTVPITSMVALIAEFMAAGVLELNNQKIGAPISSTLQTGGGLYGATNGIFGWHATNWQTARKLMSTWITVPWSAAVVAAASYALLMLLGNFMPHA